jgi:sugar/nucleoside kinase (ribokinase family)
MFPLGPATVTFIGTAVIDRVLEVEQLPGPNGTAVVTSERREFGGRGAGPAATYSALGGRAVLVSTVGSDFVSSGFEEFLQRSGVDIVPVRRESADVCCSTNTYIDSSSRDTLTFFEPRALGEEVPEAAMSVALSSDALYVAGYYSHDGLAFAAQAGRSGAPMALGLCNGIAPYVSDRLLRSLIGAASVIVFNDDEWEIIGGRLGIADESELLGMSDLLECIYHTRGARAGSGWLRGGGEFEIPVRAVEECKSTLGAGDTFMAGVLYGRLLGLDFVDSARVGSLLASLKVESSVGATFALDAVNALSQRLDSLLRAAGILT